MTQSVQSAVGPEAWPASSVSRYSVTYGSSELHVVTEFSLKELFDKFGDILWEPGNHKYNVTFFIGELDELLMGRRFSAFSQDMLDELVGKLRSRGNSNATINRKMAALSKLLRKALKLGSIHNLPEFRRQKERAGRIRFLDHDEEERLFAAIRKRSEDAWRLSIFLVDTGCRLGEAIGLTWNDVQAGRASFCMTQTVAARTIPLTKRASEAVEAAERKFAGPFVMLCETSFLSVWNEARVEVGLGADDQVVPIV